MRQNLPVTHHEVIVADGELLVSRTNLKGIIVDANQAFVKISGYSEAELIGQPHNLVRHPDMPPEAFADLWSTLKKGRPWVGIVKNRCKNGDHYWVEARVTPLRENGQITGYMSVRRNVSRERIDAAQALYARMRAGDRRQRLVHGSVYGNSALARAGFRLRQVSLRHRMQLMLMLPVLMLALAWLPSLAPGLVEGSAPVWLRGAESALAVLALLLGVSLIRSIVAPLEEMVSVCRQITAGNYFSPLDVSSAHEVGQLRHELLQMQTQLGFSVAEAERQAAENRRIRFALDTTTANVMVADTNGNIVYGNESVMAMLAGAESDLRKDLPNFRVNEVIGNNFDVFHRNPQHQRNLLAKLTGTYRAQITVGGRPFVLIASPIHDNRNERIGTVVEWVDRLSEVIVEREVKAVVDGAVRGELSRRIDTARTTGTVQQLSLGINALLDRFESVMSEVLALLNGLANGNLDCRIEGDHQGTFAQMQHDANRTAEQLSRIVGDISHAIEALSMASREIAGGNADLSQRTSAQASSLEQTVGAIQQIANAARRNAEHAQRAKQLSGNASTVADAGGTLVQTVVGTMQDIAAASARIADIISVIDGIAFQTNILALNAAVEAARAGDQGRGFAVVAAEVRELAQRSALSAKDIRSLINDSSSKVRSGVEQVQQAGATMTEIVSANRQVGDIVAEIAASSTAQSGDVDRINGAMEQMDEGTQQNAALVEETAAAARSMEEQVQALSHAVAVFRRPGAQAAMPQAIAA